MIVAFYYHRTKDPASQIPELSTVATLPLPPTHRTFYPLLNQSSHNFPWLIYESEPKDNCHISVNVTWLSILISVRVSLSRSASTKAWTPEPVMKLVSKFKQCNVLFARSMSLKAWNNTRRQDIEDVHFGGYWLNSHWLTTATGSLLRVAAMLNFFTCVFFSMAFAMSFSVGIGMFWWGEGESNGLSFHGSRCNWASVCCYGSETFVHLDVVEVDLC